MEAGVHMDFKDISYIIAVVEHQSISQAARSLYISSRR